MYKILYKVQICWKIKNYKKLDVPTNPTTNPPIQNLTQQPTQQNQPWDFFD